MIKTTVLLSFLLIAQNICAQNFDNEFIRKKNEKIVLTQKGASHFAKLALKCISKEYPNKTGQTLSAKEDLGEPSELHPAFFGCYDWHSAVHGHWMLIRLLKEFPDLPEKQEIINKIGKNITEKNMRKELAYFQREIESSYERTYGWAWLLKLYEEMDTWNNEEAKIWQQNLQPLVDLIVERYEDFLPKLLYPIRVGEHYNTAFGLVFAYDFAEATQNSSFKNLIVHKARTFYLNDTNCPADWEPGGYDFLSPCLEEAHLMSRILDKKNLKKWLKKFIPKLKSTTKFPFIPAQVSDRTDGKLVHLDGVNLSRAWCLYSIARKTDNPFLYQKANEHLQKTLPNIADGDYAGEHWLASFAVYALTVL